MKYNVGDKVRIKNIDWWNYNNVNSINESVSYVKCKDWNFINDMKKYCGKILTITEVHKEFNRYKMSADDNLYSWTDEMIEGLVEEEMKSEDGLLDEYEELTDRAFKGGYEKCKSDIELNGFQLPEGYIFKDENGNEILTSKIILEKKKKKYPKTYEECCRIFQYNENLKVYPPFSADIPNYDALHLFDLLEALRKLLICRDAYWKIAGEEMGFGKPWEPDWESETELKYTIVIDANKICEGQTIQINTILAFPTEEMRDVFKENFDPDIEICKELL